MAHYGCLNFKAKFFFTSILIIGTTCSTLQSTSPTICVERLHAGSYLNLKGHPASKKHAIVATQSGLIQLVTIPDFNSNAQISVVLTWLNLTSRVVNSGERGLLGVAFHPKYLQNGKIYVSYICDGRKTPDCQGPCACNSDIGCTVGVGGTGCTSNTVVSEFIVSNPKNVTSRPNPVESKRIMTYGRIFSNHNGGDIFFRRDGYLFITSGDGGSSGDPYNAAQSGKSFLGKIHRINVDQNADGKNYSIPRDNPFVNVSGVLPEIFALGLRNPWRCSTDNTNGAVFCGDVGQNKVEEIDRIYSGYNYGWSRFEGSTIYKKSINITLGTRKIMGPIFQYSHWGVNITGIPQGGNSVTGGVVYRSTRNSCLQGKYIYNDLYGGYWLGTVYPPSGQSPSTSVLTPICSSVSPLSCGKSGSTASMGYVWSWGVDSNNDVFALSSSGIHRITNSTKCGFTC